MALHLSDVEACTVPAKVLQLPVCTCERYQKDCIRSLDLHSVLLFDIPVRILLLKLSLRDIHLKIFESHEALNIHPTFCIRSISA